MQKTNFPTLHSIADTALKNGQYLLNAVSAPVCRMFSQNGYLEAAKVLNIVKRSNFIAEKVCYKT